MVRPNGWIVGTLALALFFAVAVRPEARASGADFPASQFSIPPAINLSIQGCASVEVREDFERGDCLQAVRIDLIEGTIDLFQALDRLEICTWSREDLESLGVRRKELRADAIRARVAFGEILEPSERDEYAALISELGWDATLPESGAVSRLRTAGVTANGLDSARSETIVTRLGRDDGLRRDFRRVFGDRLADDLEALLANSGVAPAVLVGRTVIVPNLRPAYPTADGRVVTPTVSESALLVVDAEAYAARVAAELRTLELARRRYLESAAEDNQRTGSIQIFVSSLRPFGRTEGRDESIARVVQDRAAMHARLVNLDRRLGLDPLLARSASESVGLVTEISRACHGIAANRQRWIHTGAGVLTGLVGAAGVVVASGATGTLLGGLTIAAAVEGTLGAYLIARSERLGDVVVAGSRSAAALPEDTQLRGFRRPAGEHELEDGTAGDGSGEHEIWFADRDDPIELALLEGDGVEEEGEDRTEQRPRENTIPPVLPLDIPNALRELPPLLDSPQLTELRELTLPEIQERLDEFLTGSDPSLWARLVEDEEVESWSAEEMMAEAISALALWKDRRALADRFGQFFIQAELERLPVSQRGEVLLRAMGRYLHDRELYAESRDVEDLRRRVASRLVAHCRTGAAAGDLALSACTNESALSVILVAALHDASIEAPEGTVVGVQAFDSRFEAVLYSRQGNFVHSLTKGTSIEGVVAPIYHPATFYYSYLLNHGVMPEIDLDEHLLIALPNRPMPAGMDVEECESEDRRSVVGRAVDWVGSMVGVRRTPEDPCGGSPPDERSRSRGAGGGIDISMPTPPNPVQRGGGQSGGGGQGGGGSGGGNPLAGNAPSDPLADGAGASRGEAGGQGSAGQTGTGDSAADDGAGGSGSGATGGDEPGDGTAVADASASPGASTDPGPDGSAGGSGGSDGASESSGAGGTGGYGIDHVPLPPGPNLAGIGRETVRMTERYDNAPNLRIMPWRLRDDEGMMTGSSRRVMYADNPRALERFGADDLFITLTPAEVEAQRRMQEADAYPIFQAEADCTSPNLPPRRVFRRAATGENGFRYVYCDQDESMVIFRGRGDAESFANLSAPDRPLFLARLASERLARFERSEEIGRLNAFLEDPNVLREFSREEIYATVRAAADLLVFQNALESALVQSMNELGPSGIRSHYYDMHRQVLQAPFFIRMAENVHRLNQRLASDPLQSLAWANTQPSLARQGFFDLYYTVGGMMEWPERWATLQRRYGDPSSPPPATDPAAVSLDFLQIMSDPTRVQVDWHAERSSNPSIRDRQMQDGMERAPEERSDPTLATQVERQDEIEHQRGGTGGLGRTGEGDSAGPERGRTPLQMVRIRVVPDDGDPDRERLPDDNQVRPGGTEGQRRTQTEESASRQEPLLWVSPETFIEAILSPWDGRDLRPESAGRVPPILRFNERLRDVFVRDLRPIGAYDNRLRSAMEVFTRSDWLRYAEVREAMGGSVVRVQAHDTGRFSGAYGGNPPINDQDQIRIPNFFTRSGTIIPSDLYSPVREHYTQSILGIFDLSAENRVPESSRLRSLPLPPGETAENDRDNLLRSLEIIRQQAQEAN
jgi:hypothetical protein